MAQALASSPPSGAITLWPGASWRPTVGVEVKVMAMEAKVGGADKSVVGGAIWMVVITLALFFVPLINGLIGGIVGGYRVGDWKRALGAAVIPALVAALGLWLIVAALGGPVWGFAAGAAVGLLVLLADLGIFVGAAIGGIAAQHTRGRATAR
jgi:hypothetical protein